MSRFSGPSGGMSAVRKQKRAEAEDRNALTPIERTAKFRRSRAVVQAALAEARAERADRRDAGAC